jgi:hypothetical protein
VSGRQQLTGTGTAAVGAVPGRRGQTFAAAVRDQLRRHCQQGPARWFQMGQQARAADTGACAETLALGSVSSLQQLRVSLHI